MLLQTYADDNDMVKDAVGGDGDHVDPKTFRNGDGCLWKPLLSWSQQSSCGNTTISMTSTMMQWCQLMAQTQWFPSTSHSGRAGSAAR